MRHLHVQSQQKTSRKQLVKYITVNNEDTRTMSSGASIVKL